MNYIRTALRVSLFVAVALMVTSSAQAQATRTYVSGMGNDGNPCTRSAPCRTFAAAISKTAMGGEIDVLDPGSYGPVTITQSITIDGTGTLAAIDGSQGYGILIQITAAGDPGQVRLRGLSIHGLNAGMNGIAVAAATSVSVEDSVVDGFALNTQSSGIVTIAGALFVRKTVIRNNTFGVSVASTATMVGLSDVSVVFNNTTSSGTLNAFNNVFFFGNTNGDTATFGGAIRATRRN